MESVEAHVSQELAEFIHARHALQVAQNLLSEQPDNEVLTTRVELATSAVKEASAILRAALASKGRTIEELQQELRSKGATGA